MGQRGSTTNGGNVGGVNHHTNNRRHNSHNHIHHLTLNGTDGGNGAQSQVDQKKLLQPLPQQFKRSSHTRMSLPIMQSSKLRRQAYSQLQRRGQNEPRSLGHIYLQHKGETKQANLPNELTTLDTIRALFVCAFPHMLTMEYMSQPHVKIYIYNPSCNIFYELCDIEEVRHESVLRIHHSDPLIQFQSLPTQYSGNSVAQYSTLRRLPPARMTPMSSIAPPRLPPPPPPHFNNLNSTPQPQHQTIMSAMSVAHMGHPHHLLTQFHHIPSLPPPKPRRMIPINDSIRCMSPNQ